VEEEEEEQRGQLQQVVEDEDDEQEELREQQRLPVFHQPLANATAIRTITVMIRASARAPQTHLLFQ
jgi:hypothetical protein